MTVCSTASTITVTPIIYIRNVCHTCATRPHTNHRHFNCVCNYALSLSTNISEKEIGRVAGGNKFE